MFSIMRGRCPRCHEGAVFQERSLLKGKGYLSMHKRCDHCGLNYQPEPGFYFGASYVSYALTTAVSIAVFTVLFPFYRWDNEWVYIGGIGGAILLTVPFNFRLSRLIWLNFFFKYKTPEERAKGEQADFSDFRGEE